MKMMAPFQRRPISSLAWWNRVHSCGAFLAASFMGGDTFRIARHLSN